MFPWNRKEVFLGVSAQDFSKAQNVLAENGIRYDTRVVDPSHTRGIFTQARSAAPFLNQDYVRQYYVYVAPGDYEQAKYLLSR